MSIGPTGPTGSAGPIGESERYGALDATRGVALLGIFLVNVQMMAHPLGVMLKGGLGEEGSWSRLAWHVEHIFAESRSFPLFSMLFGMGIAMQWSRANAAGRAFGPTYVRRLLVLGAVGLAHALFLWFGDILFYYACMGLVVMAFVRCEARTQAFWGIGFYGVAVAMLGVLTVLSAFVPEATPAAGAALDPARLPDVRDLVNGLTQGQVSSPDDAMWIGAETRAMRDGPYWDATSMRLLLWVSGLFFYFLLTGHVVMILGLFLLGSAMMRSGMLTDSASPWPKRMVIVGMGVALPISIALSYLSQHSHGQTDKDVAAMLHSLIGPIQSMGYLGAIVLLYRRVRRPGALAWLESAGRMPLTNYLTQSVVGAAVFQHWGFEQFGAWPYWKCVVLVLGVFAGQLIFSRLWLATFRFGPMEWLWRVLSYGRMPAMRRGGAGTATDG